VYGALRVGDGHEVTMTAPSRNSANYQRFLGLVEQANPTGTIMVVTDNLSSHTSSSTRTWLVDHPRIQHAFIPKRACWLNLGGGLVAAVSPRGAGRGDLRHPERDHPGDQGGDLSAQRPCPPVAVEPPTTVPTPPTTNLRLPPLRNTALVSMERPAPVRI
jgi:DDE superfamily endonuclease